jgi:hypothetical protein
VALDPALRAPDPLPRDAPEQPLALVTVRGLLGRPQNKVVRRGARDRIDHSLKCFLVDV